MEQKRRLWRPEPTQCPTLGRLMAVQKSSAPMCVNCVQSLNLCGKWPPLTFSKMLVSAMSQVRLDQLLYVSYLPVSWLFSLSKIEKLWKRARTEMWQPWRPAQGSQFAAPEELNSGWCGCGADHKSFINHSYPWPQNPTPSSIRAESGRDKIPYSLRTRS
jgi:hypothetical protein